MRRTRALFTATVAALAIAVSGEEGSPGSGPPLREGPVLIARVAGTINPASADYLVNAITQAQRERAALLVIELDTLGGMVTSTRDIVQAMLSADVPVAVYVSPKGAWAASAGTFITMAAHVAAMAPRASIGAAHPVSAFGPNPAPPLPADDGGGETGTPAPPAPSDYESQKAENTLASFIESIAEERGRNVEWAERAVRESIAASAEQALALGVVDVVASDLSDLLRQVDGRTVHLAHETVRISVKGAARREIPMGALAQFLHTIWDPTIALMLLSAGGILLWLEFSSPGVSVPGILGVICILVAAVSLRVLPFSWLGLLLFVGGLGLLGIEVLVPSHGLLFIAGLVAMLLGGSMVFDRPDASDLNVPFWSVVVPVVGSLGAFGALVIGAVARVLRAPSKLGEGELLGMRGVASTALSPSGTVALRGELWSADAEGEIAQGDPVEVVAIEGMRLRVRRAPKRA